MCVFVSLSLSLSAADLGNQSKSEKANTGTHIKKKKKIQRQSEPGFVAAVCCVCSLFGCLEGLAGCWGLAAALTSRRST